MGYEGSNPSLRIHMKALLYGKDAAVLQPQLIAAGIEVVSDSPDVVVSFGGDGTLLHAERAYPGVLKVPVRNSKICKLCPDLPHQELFARLAKNEFKISQVPKLQAVHAGETQWALNDVLISHTFPTHAIRFTITINGKAYAKGKEIVGDGIIVATPFGSGAYYRSITDGTFSTGIGLAFNNCTEQVEHIVLKETDTICFTLSRGEAQYTVDTEPLRPLSVGDTVEITSAQEIPARIASFGEEFTYWNAN